MSAATVFTGEEQGFVVVSLRTEHAELAMVPALGGRVISLRGRRSGREWCWRQPRADWLWASDAGSDFGRSPQAGIDECVPTVAACVWRGRRIPDHGEVWFQPWTLDPAELAAGRLSTTVRLAPSPFAFARAIEATADGFAFRYALTNVGHEPEEFLWSLHPLFTIEPGDRLELPAGVERVRLNGGRGDRPVPHGDFWAYPEPFPSVRLDHLETPGMPHGCVKAFVGPLADGRAALVNDRQGARLELGWDARQNPWLGLWLNRGHAGFHHVALEPTNGAPDALDEAVTGWRQFGRIPPAQTVRWTITWHLR